MENSLRDNKKLYQNKTFSLSRIFFLIFLFIFIMNLIYLQEAYPLQSIIFSGCYLILLLLSLYSSIKTQICLPKNIIYIILLYTAFIFFSWLCLLNAPVPAFGYSFFGNLIEGQWLLIFVLLIKLNLSENKESSVKSEHIVNPIFVFCVFFISISVILSIYGIYQRYVGFEKQYNLLASERFFEGQDSITDGIQFALREKRVFSTFGNPNLFACFLSISIPLFIAFISIYRKNKKLLFGLIISLVLILFTIFLTRSRGGALTALFCIGFFLFANRYKHKLKLITILLFSLVLIFMLFTFFNLERIVPDRKNNDKNMSIKNNDKNPSEPYFKKRLLNITTIRERLFYIYAAKNLILLSPFTGNGLGSYESLYSKYKHSQARESKFVHNYFFQMWSEIGLGGIILFVLWLIHIYKNAIKNIFIENKSENLIYIALITSLTGIILNGLIEYSFYSREIFLTLCLISGLLISSHDNANLKQSFNKYLFNKYIMLLIVCIFTILFYPLYIYRPAMASFYSYYAGIAVREDGDFGIGKDLYSKAISWNPKMPWYWSDRALSKFSLGENESGFKDLENAIMINPFSASLRSIESSYYMKIKMPEKALKSILKACQNYPTNAKYHYEKSVLLESMGNVSEAKKSIKDAILFSLDEKNTKLYSDFLNKLPRDSNEN